MIESSRHLPKVPDELSALLGDIAKDFPVILKDDLVGIYLWGSLTYGAFDKHCSDVDSVVVTRRNLDDAEFSTLEHWFRESAARNPWTERLEMRFVIDGEFLDKRSRCCGFYSGEFARHGSDGNPMIWLNVGECGVTLWGRDAKLVAPVVTDHCLNDALLLELDYLMKELRKNAQDRSDRAFRYNAYAVLTACRIMHTAQHRSIVSKEQACEWAMSSLPPERRAVVATAWENRVRNHGSTTPQMETDAVNFVCFAREQLNRTFSER